MLAITPSEHYNSNCVWLTSGFLVENLSLNCNPIINDTIAFDSAVYYVNSETYVLKTLFSICN